MQNYSSRPDPYKVNSVPPNMRFGAAFMDVRHKDHAVNGEFMSDKTTGEIVYKRKADGKLLWFSHEDFPLYDFISQVKSHSETYVDYIEPTEVNCEKYPDILFMGANMQLSTFVWSSNTADASLLKGDRLLNTDPMEFTFTQETNGFYLWLQGKPRDRAVIGYLNNLYNRTYRGYVGEDPELIKKADMFLDCFNFTNSQFIVNYTVYYYTDNDVLYFSETGDGYLSINEMNFIPFKEKGIFGRDLIKKATLRINYFAAPKLAEAVTLIKSDVEEKLYKTFLDVYPLTIKSCTLATFVTVTDDNLILMDEASNMETVFTIGIQEYNDFINRIITGVGASRGVTVSVKEPSRDAWQNTAVWIELMRNVIPPMTPEYTGSPTIIQDIEDALRGYEHAETGFSSSIHSTLEFYIKSLGSNDVDIPE